MISRRENLLLRPWQQKRYDNHRRKVQSAGPVIDNKPPVTRQHVLVKLKKQQKEMERCREIEKNNFLLLRKINEISRTTRVDNRWNTQQPNFLNRVALFDIKPRAIGKTDETVVRPEKPQNRREKCYACTPQQLPEITIPEERVPWEPEKLPLSRRFRSRSVPARQPDLIRETLHSAPIIKQTLPKNNRNNKITNQQSQSILVSRGCLKLLVNFPADTFVKFKTGHQERILMHGLCHCKNC